MLFLFYVHDIFSHITNNLQKFITFTLNKFVTKHPTTKYW